MHCPQSCLFDEEPGSIILIPAFTSAPTKASILAFAICSLTILILGSNDNPKKTVPSTFNVVLNVGTEEIFLPPVSLSARKPIVPFNTPLNSIFALTSTTKLGVNSIFTPGAGENFTSPNFIFPVALPFTLAFNFTE